MAQDIERSPTGAGYWPQRVRGGRQTCMSTDTGECLGEVGCITGLIEDAEVFQPRSVQVSWAELQFRDTAFVSASQTVGSFTQTATGDVSGGGGTADFSASQTVGSFTQTATAQAWAQAQASQTVSAFGRSATAQAWAGLQAAQTVGAFTQSASGAAWAQASASQAVGAFSQVASAVVVAPRDITASQTVGAFGQVATAENDSPVVQTEQATPGYSDARGRFYRVRVGKRWLTVDPLDPETLKAVYVAAEQEAERVAEQRVVEPAKSAAQVVKVEAPRVDYAGLAADAKRISEQVREVYAAALQRELIARLMREQMDREDDDAVLMLLLG